MKIVNRIPANFRLGLAYFVTASLGAGLTRFEGGVAFLWVASGLLIADLIIRPRRQWLRSIVPCAVASLLATGLFGLGWAMALPFMAINMIEATVAVWLFRRKGFSRQPLGSLASLMNFIMCAGIIAPTIVSVLAASALAARGFDPFDTLIQFFLGHALGNLIIAPLALLVARGRYRRAPGAELRRRPREAALLFTLVAATALIVFAGSDLPLLFLPILPVILLTFRLGRGAAGIGIILLALIGGAATLAGIGPLEMLGGDTGTRVQFFQFYLASTVLTVLPVAADLENRRRLHSKLRLSEMRYRLLAEHSTDILIHFTRDGKILYISPSIRLFGGHDPAVLIGQDSRVLVAPEHREDARANYVATMAAGGETRTFDFLAATADGSTRWYETHARAILDEEGRVDGLFSVVRDVSARKASEQQMAVDALTDPLTGLFNRRAFRAAAKQRSVAPGAVSTDCVAVLDLDHFKVINDSFGHAAGDEILRGFARITRRMVRENDVVARVGGEEFAILFPDTSLDQAMLICERLRVEIARSSLPAGASVVRVTVSGGVATIGHEGLEHALEIADIALYNAKRDGRDRLARAA